MADAGVGTPGTLARWHYFQQAAEQTAAEMTAQDGRARRVWRYVNGDREWWRISEIPTTRLEA